MDYFTHKRLLIGMVVVLVILNLGSLTTIWILWKPARNAAVLAMPPPVPPPPPPLDLREVMASELNLTEEQEVRIRHASERFIRRSEDLLRVYHRDKRRLMEELAAARPDSVILGHLTFMLGQQQTELERIMVDYFLELRQVYTPGQRKNFRTVIDKVLHQMSLDSPKP